MQLIKQTAELVTQQPGIVGMKKLCELVGRVCYHSEDKITEDSYIKFLDNKKMLGHMSPFEAGTVYLSIASCADKDIVEFFKYNTYSYVVELGNVSCITTNYRVIVENDLEEVMEKYWCEPTEYHLPRVCIKSQTCIEVYKDLTRHRSHSPMIESTRFCNYMSDKFSRSVSFTMPNWLGYRSDKPDEELEWLSSKLKTIESIYFEAQEKWGWDSQRASYLLPQGTKATVFLTAFVSDWEWLLKLRYEQITGKVRPDVLELTEKFAKILNKLNYYKLHEA